MNKIEEGDMVHCVQRAGRWPGRHCSKTLLAAAIFVAACGDQPNDATTLATDDQRPELNAATASLQLTASPDPVLFTHTCDGSAAALLGTGQIVIANDEDSTLRVYDAKGGAPVASFDLASDLSLADGEPDFEAAASRDGRVYWITSHGRTKKAKMKDDRFRFFATDWDGSRLAIAGRPRSDLLDTARIAALGLDQAEPLAPEKGGINVEALAFRPDGTILLGLRSPLDQENGMSGLASAVELNNPAELLAATEGSPAVPKLGQRIKVDLGGRGIRDMIPYGDGFLLIAGPVADSNGFELYRWDGRSPSATPVAADLSGLRPEALVDLGGGRVMVLSDEGDTTLAQHDNAICKDVAEADRSFPGRIFAPR